MHGIEKNSDVRPTRADLGDGRKDEHLRFGTI